MKIRNGFISNSSSTSFVIGVNGAIDYDTVIESLKVPKDSPLYPIAEDVANFFVYDTEEISLDDLLDYCNEDEISKLPEVLQKVAENGMNIYKATIYTDGEDIERLIFTTPFNYSSDKIVIYKWEF